MHVRIIQPFTITGVGVYAPGDPDVQFDAELGDSLIAGGLCLPADAPAAVAGQTTTEVNDVAPAPSEPNAPASSATPPTASAATSPLAASDSPLPPDRPLTELGLPQKVLVPLELAGIITETQARAYLAAHGSFEPLTGVGPALSRLIVGLLG